jgi:protein-tyrosine phosphatase
VIDIHCHVLPHLDDGAKDWETSLSMARTASQDGISQCIATPHWTGKAGEADLILSRAEELRARLAEAGIPLRLHVGNEVILVPSLIDALKERQALTLGNSHYVLLETAQLEQGAYTHQALFQLQASGYRVILAHPERVQSWQTGLGEVRDFLRRGCRLQINAASLGGGFGRQAKKTAEQLLRLGWVSLLATDAHGLDTRPQIIRPALKRCAELLGEEAARALVEDNPARILCDEELPYVDVDTAPKRSLFSFPWWRRQ